MTNRRHFLSLLPLSGMVSRAFAAPPAEPDREPDVELELTAAPAEIPLLPGNPTKVWRFTGKVIKGPPSSLQSLPNSYLGPVLRLRRGQHVRIRFRNNLGEPSIIHWHGLDIPENADGHPRFAIGQNQEFVSNFTVINRAGTYWYHPHPHMRTAPQVYKGLAGLVIVSDEEEEKLTLPSGPHDLLWVIQDRRISKDNQFLYAGDASQSPTPNGPGRGRGMGRGGMRAMMETMNGWLGDRILVSGIPDFSLSVDRRAYRIRLLNGSNARITKLAWHDNSPLTLIATDGGLLPKPLSLKSLTLAPGQRAELLLDLSAWQGPSQLKLVSLEFPSDDVGMVGMMADSSPAPQGAPLTIATLNISDTKGPGFPLPDSLSSDSFKPDPAAPVRPIPLYFMQMAWMIDGEVFDMQAVSDAESVTSGSTHLWEFENQENPMGMAMAHPMHIHGTQFRIVSRSGGGPNSLRDGIHDAGWQDTVLVLPGEKVRVQIRFSSLPGLYLYHCHILEHEDMGMMRNFRITPPAGP
jgi:FtsP/CotA-like multicopper oxidase with cupredoxin domain